MATTKILTDYRKTLQQIYSANEIPFYSPSKRIYLYTKAEIQDALNEGCRVLCETREFEGKTMKMCFIEIDFDCLIKYAKKG